jgi:Protein of unknown function DUF45
VKRRRFRCGSLRRRYGNYRLPSDESTRNCEPGVASTKCLPRVKEAKSVKAAKKADVGWLARTEPKAKEVEFSEAFDKLTPEAKRYIVLHERAHLKTGPDHNANFYSAVMKLAKANKIDPWVAFELEQYNCHQKH